MVLKNKILWGVLGVVVIVCFLQGKAFSLTHPLSGVLIDNASESSLISQTDQAYAALLLQNTQQKETFSSFNKTTNAEANQLIALSSKKNIHQKTFSDSDLPVINKFTTLNTVSSSAAATITSSASSGNWSNPTSWSGGVVPGASDDVVITAGTTILVDANTTCQSITIESGGILQIANSITLTLTGDWTNSGSFDAGTSGVVEFTGSTSSTISGTTTFEELIISKDNLSIPITITGNVTVSSGGNLTLTGGLIQVNSLASLKLDYSNQLTIPEAAGLEVNGGTLETGNFSITNEGLIRVNSGIANFGTASGNSVHTQVDGAFHVIDGTVNIAGRLENTAGGTLPPDIPSGINISGGTINLATEGNGLSNTGSLQVSTQGAFNFTGGTIVFQNASTASTAIDMGLSDGTGNGSKTITNGIFQFGNGSTTSLSEFVIDSEIPIPNIEVYDNMDLALASPLTISNELVLGTNTQISLNTNSLKMKIVPSFGSIDIPLSDDSGNAMPLSVEITSGSYASDASITVSSVEGKPGSNANTSDYLNRYWTLDINGITGLEYNVLADYPPSDVIGTESAITMGVYTGSLPWIKGSITTSTNEVSAIGLYAPSILFSGITAAPPTIVIDNNDPMAICEGSSVNLTTTATGDPTLTYDWTPTTGLSASNIANPTASPTTTTTYQVTVTDGNGFTASDAIDVVVNPLPTLSSLTQNEAVCANNPATIVLSGLIPNSTFDLVYSIDGVNQPTITGLSSDASGASSFNTTSLAATDNGKNLEISSLTITSTASGCSAPFSQSITLAINSPPAFTSCPTALIEAFTGAAVCQANVSYTVAATGTPAPSYTFTFSGATTASGNGTGSGETFNLGTTTVTVTATNSCGNESCSFDIEVKDNEAPTPITLASVTEQCKYSPANYPTTTDNCDGVITGVPNVSFPYATTGVSTITWSFTDNAGNTTTVDQIVTINDTQSPTWDSFPTDKNVECGTDTTPTTTGTPTVSDNCDNSPTLDFSDVVTNGNCAGRYTITRTWRAKDSSDNDVTRVQTINVDDTTQPILTCTDLTVANPDEIPLSDEFVGISAIDNCGIDTIMPISEVYHGLDQSAGFCPTGVTRTYRAYDNCGNTIECTQYIAVTSAGSCEKCQADVPFFSAILDGNPDSLWISPQTKREGICCGVTQDQGEGPPRCVSFNVYLDEDAVGLIFDINSGARPKGALFYQIDCGPETPVGEEICLAGGQFYLVTFCKPGANQNTYSIQSISGATDTEDIVTRADEGCVGNISVTGLDPNGDITWTVKSPNDQSLLNYLDLTDPLNPVFTADENSPATIIYEVCGEVAGTYKCEGNPIIDCAEVTVSVLSPISISFDVDLGDICEGDIPIINAGITPTNIDFDYYWYDGPDGTGNVLSTDPYWQPGGEGNYSLVVIDNETGVGCNRAISNFNITYDKIGPSIWSPPSGNLELNCNDPEAEQKIAAWIATATAQEDDGSSIPITTDYEIFDHACGGKRTVTFSAKDQCDNTSTATADIIIQDNDDPVITQQPSDGSTDCVYLNPEEDAGYQAWLNNHGGATASDQCDPTLTWTNNSATQSWVTDPLTNTKTKTVTFTVTDDCGNFVDTEEATYTLTDDSPPTLTCPEGPFVFQALLGDCELIVNDPSLTPSFSDECSDPVLTYSMLKPDGSTETGSGSVDGKTFLVGTTTVTYTVTDDVENKAECSFDVQVTDLNKPIFTYGCPDNPLPVNAEEGLCEALVNIPIPEVSDPCNEGYTLVNSFNGTNNATDSYPVGTTIVTWTVTDASNNVATCEQTVIVNDTQDPTISCPTSTNPAEPDLFEEFISGDGCDWAPTNVPNPTYADNCGVVAVTYELSGATTGSSQATGFNYVSEASLNVGITTVTYTSWDAAGNASAPCSIRIWIKNLNAPKFSVSCPAGPDQTIEVSAETDQCEADVTVPAPGITNPCNEAYTITNNSPYKTSDTDASGTYPVGTTTVTWTITDASGNVTNCEQTVIVNDTQDPTISCPTSTDPAEPDLFEEFISGDGCDWAPTNVPNPAYADNCGVVAVTYELSGATTGSSQATGFNYVSDASLNVGITTVTYTSWDATGNASAPCSIRIWIKNLNAPKFSVSCPAGPDQTIEVNAEADQCEAGVTVPAPGITNPCNEAYTITNDSPYKTSDTDASGTYPVGITTVTWTITDASGNVTTCEQTITVNDLLPQLECPENIVVQAEYDKTYNSNVSLDPPTWGDNCPDPVLTWELVPPTGYETQYDVSELTGTGVYPNPNLFYLGTTRITYTVTDTNENTKNCSFTVTVLGAPEITCADDITRTTDADVCSATFDPGIPTLNTGTPPISWTWTITNPDGTTQTGSSTGNAPDPSPTPIGNYEFQLGITTITWRADNISGYDECTQTITITDGQEPVITSLNPIEECVEALSEAIYYPPTIDINPTRPDYFLFEAGSTSLDLDLTTVTDNCAPDCDYSVRWQIDFSPTPDPVPPHNMITQPSLTGTGQLSTYTSDIKFPGDGVNFTNIVHTITYWVEDCNGNESAPKQTTITITPRPNIIKMN